MTYSQGSTHGAIAEINIIPLADVMLVLLIIFDPPAARWMSSGSPSRWLC